MKRQREIDPRFMRIALAAARRYRPSPNPRVGAVVAKRGEVIAVGPGKFDHGNRVPMSVKVGDKVILKKYGPDKVKIEGVEYLVAEESDIIATTS